MKATKELHDLGQSVWLDNITRRLLTKGTLRRYITELSVTGLTSNPTIYDHAIKNNDFYDETIRQKMQEGKSGEELFFELALEDLTQAADLFRPISDATGGVDGWVSLKVSPLLAYDTAGSIKEATKLHGRAKRPNLFIKIPGTPEGLPAIEEAIFKGVPVNVTLLFSRKQYIAAAEAYMRGIERRIEAGLAPVAETCRGRSTAAAPPVGNTGTKDPKVSDVLYIAGRQRNSTAGTRTLSFLFLTAFRRISRRTSAAAAPRSTPPASDTNLEKK